jgi:hypothetical protein
MLLSFGTRPFSALPRLSLLSCRPFASHDDAVDLNRRRCRGGPLCGRRAVVVGCSRPAINLGEFNLDMSMLCVRASILYWIGITPVKVDAIISP